MSLEDLIRIKDQAIAASSAKRAEKKAKPTPEAWRRVWLDELKKYYPAYVIAYSDAAAANLKRAITHRGLPVQDVSRLLVWIVGNWEVLRKKVFSFNIKVPRGPEAPDMGMVIKYLPQIYGLFNTAKPENALSLPRLTPAAAKPAAITLAPPRSAAPAKPATPGNVKLMRPLQIDHAKADATRAKLGFRKWGE